MNKKKRKIKKGKVVKNKKAPSKNKTLSKKKQEAKKEVTSIHEFMKTGIKGFDALFEKGFGIPKGGSVLVEGGPGSGKTVFCLSVINSLCKQGKRCFYMSFEEPEGNLIQHMKYFNFDVDSFIKKDLFRVKRFDAIDVSRSVEALLSAAKKELLIEIDPVLFPEDFKPDFVVIDSLTSIASAFSGHESRFRIYMEQLFRYLEKNKITNFLIREVANPAHIGSTFKEEGEAVSFLSDGIIVIYNIIYDSGVRTAALEILKMRGSYFKKKIVEMNIINKKGAVVNPNKIIKKKNGIEFRFT